jgi:hypothetical protein
MKISSPILRNLGALTFAIGVLLSTLLTAALTWAPLEAELYGFPRYTTERFDGLSCPRLMTRSERGVIRASVRNPSQEIISPIVSIRISGPVAPIEEQAQVRIQPGETRMLEWPISSENIDLERFIFAKVNRSPSYPLPGADAMCGTLVLDWPWLNGLQILSVWLALCLVCIPAGMWMWSAGTQEQGKMPGVMKALAALALGGLFVSLQGIWLLGILFITVTILATGTLLRVVARP